MHHLFKFLNQNKPKLREFDPTTVQRIKEGAYLVRSLAKLKWLQESVNCLPQLRDQEIASFFDKEAKKLTQAKKILEQYYETITKE